MASVRTKTAMVGELGRIYSLGSVGSLSDGQLLERYLAGDEPAVAEAAFSALVDRHGAMVLSVCQRALQNPHDAHDAFQATFLVMVRKARTIRRRESVAGWLYGIARRVASRSRLDAARRRRHLAALGQLGSTDRMDELPANPNETEPDYGPLIAEIDLLPDRFREPVVLHYFEGLSTEATALRLGCPRGTVLSRLARARDRLRRRLERQGIALEAILPANSLASRLFSGSAVPGALTQATVKSAACLALANSAIEKVVPVAVASLSRGVVRNLIMAKVRVASLLILLGVVGAVIGLTAIAPAADKPQDQPAMKRPPSGSNRPAVKAPAPKTIESPAIGTRTVRGQVLDPDGKPLAGARVVLTLMEGEGTDNGRTIPVSTTGADGRFHSSIKDQTPGLAAAIRPGPFNGIVVAALYPGLGPDWVKLDPARPDQVISLRLRRDDVPIEGQILGLEGQPLPNLKVMAQVVTEFPAELFRKLRENAGMLNPGLWGEMRNALVLYEENSSPTERTGRDGRFRLKGVGRDRVALLVINGDSIEQTFAMVFTASDPKYVPILMPPGNGGENKILGPKFTMTAAPGRVFDGVIRDYDNGKPIAGARIYSWWSTSRITSDAQGRFRMASQPKRADNRIDIEIDGQPYLKVGKVIPDSQGLQPIHLDVRLKRGVWVEGKVTNRVDGKPVKAVVVYYPMRDNPHLKECPDATFLNNHVGDEPEFPTDAEGRFRAIALPGPGLLAVRTSEPGYLAAPPLSLEVAGNISYAVPFQSVMSDYHAFVPINAEDGGKLVIPDVIITPGRLQHVRVIGPDGRPVAVTRVFGDLKGALAGELVRTAEFTVVHPKPGTEKSILVIRDDQSAGRLLQVKGDEPDPIELKLKPTGSVVGRLVDEEGRPRPNVMVALMQDLGSTRFERFNDRSPTDAEGRFQLKGLVPGVWYNLDEIKNSRNYSERFVGSIHKDRWTVKPGETQNWGDVQVKKYQP